MDSTSPTSQSSQAFLGSSFIVKYKKLLILLVLLAMIALWLGSGYNGLVTSREAVNRSWSAVQSDYQRRADLVPNLVSTVKGAANFEQETLTQVTEARAKATQITVDPSNAQDLQNFQAAQGELGSALSRLLVVSEQYPQLQAVQAFRDLQVQLEGTENRISVSRKDYGTAVNDFNTKRNRFPTVILASLFGFDERPYFQADDSAQSAPKVDFTNPTNPPITPPAGN